MVTKLRLKQRYDETAKIYDKRYEEIQRAKYRLVLENLPPKVKRLLDLGCGTGMFLNELSSRSEFVVGLDVSSEMLEVAKGRAGKAHLVLADADALPFIDGSFDVVVSVTLLQNMPDPTATLREAVRVLRPGGTAVFTVLKKKHSLTELETWMRLVGMRVIKSGEMDGNEDVYCVARL